MQVRVLVTLEVEESGDTKISRQDMEDAAAEAVENAVRSAESSGFSHGMEEELSILLVDVVPYEEDPEDKGELGESEDG
jgi:hypothetical protein